MYLTYKYKLRLTNKQKELISSWIGTCRFIYNLALETKIEAYKSNKKSINKFDLIGQLTELKDINWIKSVPSQSLQNVIERLDKTYQTFFRGGGFPKWAKKDKYNSILFKSVKLEDGWFILPKIRRVKVFKDRLPDGNLKTAIIKKENNTYYLYITFESQLKPLLPNENQVGIDVGITYFLVDSNGYYVINPRHFKQFERKLRIEQRALSRKKYGSKRRNLQKKKVLKLMNKIASIRADFLHKLSHEYIKNNGIIICEKLNVGGMSKNKYLSKHILDCSWSSFFKMLEYKSKLYVREFIKVNPMFTSQECSVCGHISKESRLSQKEFKCIKCGFKENADYNAAKNILSRGTTFMCQREALACA